VGNAARIDLAAVEIADRQRPSASSPRSAVSSASTRVASTPAAFDQAGAKLRCA